MPNFSLILNVLSPILGLIGTLFIFFFGVPRQLDTRGAIFLALEQSNESEERKTKQYKLLSYVGVLFLFISFLCQLAVALIPYLR